MNGSPIRPHDLSGQTLGSVPSLDDDTVAYWERQIDAMVMLVWRKKLLNDAEMRAQVEALEPDVYQRLSYYERWSIAILNGLKTKGIVSDQESQDLVELANAKLT